MQMRKWAAIRYRKLTNINYKPSKWRVADNNTKAYAPILWNTPPADIHNASSLDMFEKPLKLHLFTTAYNLS